jgi:hypothetical protein
MTKVLGYRGHSFLRTGQTGAELDSLASNAHNIWACLDNYAAISTICDCSLRHPKLSLLKKQVSETLCPAIHAASTSISRHNNYLGMPTGCSSFLELGLRVIPTAHLLSLCHPSQDKIAYPNLCLNWMHFFNLRCSLLLLLPSLHIHCLSCHYLCLHCWVLTSRNPVCSQIRPQTPHAPANQLPQGHFWGL